MTKKTVFVMALLFIVSFVFAQGPLEGGPPEEAILACEGKNIEDACSFESPNGKESGICDTTPDGTACKPSINRQDQNNQEQTTSEINDDSEEESTKWTGFFKRLFSWLAGLFSSEANNDESNVIDTLTSDAEDFKTENKEVNNDEGKVVDALTSDAEDFKTEDKEVSTDVAINNDVVDMSDSLPNYLKNVWDCVDSDVIVTDLTDGGEDILTCSVEVSYTDTDVIIKSNGIPPHDLESTLGCCTTEQNSIWTIPIVPTEDTDGEYTPAPERGPIAFTTAGVAIYGPEEGSGGDAVANEHGYYDETRENVDLGLCGGHAGPGGQYHYHFDANCLHWHEGEEDKLWIEYDFDDLSGIEHSKVIGFALDGYPIYGSYGWDENKNVKEMLSSYRLKSDGGQGYNGIDDWEYVENFGDLDECNGHFAPTPDNPEGFYHYHSTVKNGEGKIGFPYFLLCYHGIYDDSLSETSGGQDGPPSQGPPPNGRP